MEKLNQGNFAQAIVGNQQKVIVKFYANWCPDCRRTEQGTEEIATSFGQQLSFYAVNVDEEPALAERYDVKGIPSFLVFENGAEITRLFSRDAKTKEQILAFVKQQVE